MSCECESFECESFDQARLRARGLGSRGGKATAPTLFSIAYSLLTTQIELLNIYKKYLNRDIVKQYFFKSSSFLFLFKRDVFN